MYIYNYTTLHSLNMFCQWTSDSSHQDYPITILKPIQLQQQITQKTVEEQGIQYYNELVVAIMKVMNVNNVTHCTDDNYRLITIQGAVIGIMQFRINLLYELQ